MTETEGRTAVVTGGGRGIGAAIAAALADGDTRVAVWDIDIDHAEKTAASLTPAGIGLRVDVTDSGSVARALADTTARLGPVDVLVNNAGVDVISPFLDSTEEDWERI